MNKFRNAKLLAHREIVPVDIELREQSTRFRKGDVLQLEIRGHWHSPPQPADGGIPQPLPVEHARIARDPHG